jgi:hypothetical protein
MPAKNGIEAERKILEHAVARLRAGIMAIVFGLTCGIGLFAATAWLLIRGGETVGPHLSLLNQFFPGYSVTWPGAFIGLLYGAVSGAVVAFCIAWIYNLVLRVRGKQDVV